MAIVMLSAVTRIERKTATSFVFDTVNRLGGWIDDTRMYSNLMNTIRLTLPAGAFAELVWSSVRRASPSTRRMAWTRSAIPLPSAWRPCSSPSFTTSRI